MAHGNKKWIVAYDGRIKRSNDRTKKDYYRDLKWWKPAIESSSFWHHRRVSDVFCPQCKHNFKPIKRHNDFYDRVDKEIRAEWDATLMDRVKEYKRQLRRWYEIGRLCGEAIPPDPNFEWKYAWRSGYWEYRKSQEYRLPAKPIRDSNTWLCPKHRTKSDKQDEMYRSNYPGMNRNYTWARKSDYNYYRKEVKNIMHSNFEDYDDYDILPYKKAWLD